VCVIQTTKKKKEIIERETERDTHRERTRERMRERDTHRERTRERVRERETHRERERETHTHTEIESIDKPHRARVKQLHESHESD